MIIMPHFLKVPFIESPRLLLLRLELFFVWYNPFLDEAPVLLPFFNNEGLLSIFRSFSPSKMIGFFVDAKPVAMG